MPPGTLPMLPAMVLKIAANNLAEYQRTATDAHLASVAPTYAQALVAMQSQKSFVDVTLTVAPNRPYGRPILLQLSLKNTGKSDASNIHITGWVFIAKPNSGAIGGQPEKHLMYSITKDTLRVGEQFPESWGTTKEGNPKGIYVTAVDQSGDLFIHTAELDKAIFVDRK